MVTKKSLLLFGVIAIISGCGVTKTDTEPIASNNQDIPQELLDLVTPETMRTYTTITVNDQELYVEKANSPAKITTGLSYRQEIGAEGMLFYMSQRGIPSFWMKGMLFNLDMVWIDCNDGIKNQELGIRNQEFVRDELIGERVQIEDLDCEIVDVTRNVPAPDNPFDTTNLPHYTPQFPVTHVLEVRSEK